jgi:hypothetical protein
MNIHKTNHLYELGLDKLWAVDYKVSGEEPLNDSSRFIVTKLFSSIRENFVSVLTENINNFWSCIGVFKTQEEALEFVEEFKKEMLERFLISLNI